MEQRKTTIRVVAVQSGSANIAIRGPIERQFSVHFGLVSARMAAALGTITAAKYLAHLAGPKQNVFVSSGNLDFSQYALREREPRDKEMREILEHMWMTLDQFQSWSFAFYPAKRHRLKGSPSASEFPRGVFPWLKAEIRPTADKVIVQLPDCPAVRKQFTTSIRSAVEREGKFFVPNAAEKVVRAWFGTVTMTEQRKEGEKNKKESG